MPGPGDETQAAAELAVGRLVVLCRAGLTPVLILAGLLADNVSWLFWVVSGLWVLRQVAALAVPAPSALARLTPLLDVAMLCGLIATSGAAASPLRWVVVALPMLAGFLVGPRGAAVAACAFLAAYLLPALPALVRGDGPVELVALTACGVLFSAVAGAGFAAGRERLTLRVASVDAGRRRLMTAGLGAEDSERRRVSQDLHGEALQVLLAAAQDVDEGKDDRDALSRAREGVRSGVALLRDTVRDLHPAAVRHVGLEAALTAALEHRVRGVVLVEVLPDADDAREAMLLSVVRELGDALASLVPDSAVAARVSRPGNVVQLAVSADSDAGGPAAHRAALARCAERVEAGGGHLEVQPGPDRRTLITVRLPLNPSSALGAREGDVVDEQEARRVGLVLLAALQLLAALVVWLYALLGGEVGTGFVALATAGTLLHLSALAVTLSPWWMRYPGTLVAAADIVGFGALVALQGGIGTELPALSIVFPFCAVLVFPPRRVLQLSAVLGLALLVVALPDLAAAGHHAGGRLYVLLAALAWATATSVLLGTGRQRLRSRLATSEQGRRRLLHDSLDAADAERQRLSERLHDGALQALMIAGQALDEALTGDPAALERAGAELRSGLRLLRETVAELHPPALEHGGLRPAVVAVVERARERGGFAVRVDVDPDAGGVRDELLVALVRELVLNAAKHARARTVGVAISRTADEVLLEVVDDGTGIEPLRRAAALAAGHIGLAAARERVEAEGGSMELETGTGAGTRVRITVPVGVAALS